MDNSRFELTATLFDKRVPEITADLTFPATADDMRRALAELGVENVEDCEISSFKCSIDNLTAALPKDASVDELNWLAVRLSELSDDDRDVFAAVLEAYEYCSSVADLINLTDSTDNFDFPQCSDATELGEHWYTEHSREIKGYLNPLSYNSNVMSLYLEVATESVDMDVLGERVAEAEGYIHTSYGYIRGDSDPLSEDYRGAEDIPSEFLLSDVTIDAELTLRLMLINDELSNSKEAWLTLPTDSETLREALHGIGVEFANSGTYRIRQYACPQLPSLERYFPDDANIEELNFLMSKLRGLSYDELKVFQAALASGMGGGEIGNIINLAYGENLGKFELQPAFTTEQYGQYLSDVGYYLHEDGFGKLCGDQDPDLASLSNYIDVLLNYVDYTKYAEYVAEQENGAFTDFGYLVEIKPLETLYYSTEDIPSELRLFVTEFNVTLLDDGLAAISSEAAKSLTAGGNIMVYAIAEDGSRTTLNPMDALNPQLWKSGFTFAVERADKPAAELLQSKIDTAERGKTDKNKQQEER